MKFDFKVKVKNVEFVFKNCISIDILHDFEVKLILKVKGKKYQRSKP